MKNLATGSGVIQLRLTNEALRPCPFCGHKDIEVLNTHTASYWVQCNYCDAQAHGAYFSHKNKTEEKLAHRKSFASAIHCWNMRVS